MNLCRNKGRGEQLEATGESEEFLFLGWFTNVLGISFFIEMIQSDFI